MKQKTIIVSSMLVVTLAFLFIAISISPISNAEVGQPNATILTTVIVGNARPVVDNVDLNLGTAITLTAASTISVDCNATVNDNNTLDDISSITGTLYHITSSKDAADANATHYTNSSCTFTAGAGTNATDVHCNFPTVYSFATNGTWTCDVNATDGTDTGAQTDTETVNQLVAFSAPTTIDYGSPSLGQDSSVISFMVNNSGNVQIDLGVNGTVMGCDGQGQIGRGNQTYNLTNIGMSFTENSTAITELMVTNTEFDLAAGPRKNQTGGWLLRIPSSGVEGTCTGNNTFLVALG
ncbi:hypothetical protein HQ533_02035 [Candidatus Woesearchaeota archaeon]|nr:hypothetical protein [Candidatus Woesearchaeota archaeon]